MTRESRLTAPADQVLQLAKDFFTSTDAGYAATIIDEGSDYVRFQTFRGVLAVSARGVDGTTLVRCSTLRYHPSIGQFLLLLETESPASKV